MDSLDKNLIKNIEVNIGDNKTISEMLDENLKVEKPICIGVNVINMITNPHRDIKTPPPKPKNIVSPWSYKSVS
jgi:hypothetical protein